MNKINKSRPISSSEFHLTWNKLTNDHIQLNQIRKLMSEELWTMFCREMSDNLPKNFEREYQCEFIDEESNNG